MRKERFCILYETKSHTFRYTGLLNADAIKLNPIKVNCSCALLFVKDNGFDSWIQKSCRPNIIPLFVLPKVADADAVKHLAIHLVRWLTLDLYKRVLHYLPTTFCTYVLLST